MDLLKRTLKMHGDHPDKLRSALSAMTPGELVRGLVELLTAGELRLRQCKHCKESLCSRFYRYDERNLHVGKWFLSAARILKNEERRERYSIGGLMEQMRWDVPGSVSRTDKFRISNDLQSCYVRQILMRDPSLCGLFELRGTSKADELVVDGHRWADFAKEHECELWPERKAKKKAVSNAQVGLPSERRHESFS